MVLESLLSAGFLRKNTKVALPLAFIYTMIGTGIAFIIFPNSVGLASVAFTSLLIIPSLTYLVSLEEDAERKERKLGLISMLKDNMSITKIYLNLFLGSFLTYVFISMMLPGSIVPMAFSPQLGPVQAGSAVLPDMAGQAFSTQFFLEILKNNLGILALCFLIAIVVGEGAAFFITWNASVWGVFFGSTAVFAASATNQSPVLYIMMILLIVIAVVILEAFAFILASVSGSVLSKSILNELKSKGLTTLHKYSSVVAVVSPEMSTRLREERWYAEAFSQVLVVNFALLALSVLVIFAAAIVETAIQSNTDVYAQIVAQAWHAVI